VVAALLALCLLVPGVVTAAPAAPGFRVRLLDARGTFDPRDEIGKHVVVLRFQASYCKPCARESAGFGRLVDRYRGRGVQFLAIHVQDTVRDARRFVRGQKATYPVALDPRLTIGNRYGFKGTPYTVVIDRNGEMVAQIHGESAITRLPGILDALLKTGRLPA
jgi:peroxiredoxin